MKTGQLGPGTILGRYELLLPIASGGMATVWVARSRGSRGFSKTVAIKTILPNLSDDPAFEQMFLDEAAIASKIQHPNVAQIIDLGEQDEVLYLAMEWVDGESLSTLSKFARKSGNEIPLRVGLKMMAQACAGIHSAHELRDDDDRLLELVHRDISPQNILVSASGIVKIVDFGVAKALGRTGETSAGQLKGKVPFMSPEQAKGGKVDRRTDVFALGIILYRIATGTHPFLDDNDIKTMRNIISRPVMPPRVKMPSIPLELERTILKALQKDPDKRHASAADLEIELEAAMAATGSLVPLDEVAVFVRATLGERDRKRRAAIRDAAIKMDEAVSQRSPSVGGARLSNPPQLGESVSGMMLTQTQTPPTTISASEVVSGGSISAPYTSAPGKSVAEPGASGASADAEDDSDVTRAFDVGKVRNGAGMADATPPRLSDPLLGSSPTLVAVAAPGSMGRPPSKRTRTLAIASALACGIGVGFLLILKLGAPNKPADASAGEDGRGAAGRASSSLGADASGQPSKVEVDASARARADAAADHATASPGTANPGVGTDLDLSELPDQVGAAGQKPRTGGGGKVRPGTAKTATATTSPPPTTATSKPVPTPPAGPTVQDPGF